MLFEKYFLLRHRSQKGFNLGKERQDKLRSEERTRVVLLLRRINSCDGIRGKTALDETLDAIERLLRLFRVERTRLVLGSIGY